MSGTKEGGRKAAATNLAKDPNFYSNISKKAKHKGGKNSPGSFDSQRARAAGRKGGALGKRGPGKVTTARIEYPVHYDELPIKGIVHEKRRS